MVCRLTLPTSLPTRIRLEVVKLLSLIEPALPPPRKQKKYDVVNVVHRLARCHVTQRHFTKVMTSFLTKNASHLDLDDKNC